MTRALKVVIPSRGDGEGPLSDPFDHSEYRATTSLWEVLRFAQDDGTEYGRRI